MMFGVLFHKLLFKVINTIYCLYMIAQGTLGSFQCDINLKFLLISKISKFLLKLELIIIYIYISLEMMAERNIVIKSFKNF